MKNEFKAKLYVIGGSIFAFIALVGTAAMWFSGSFLPVLGVHALRNRILRYALYSLLLAVIILSAKLADYGFSYLRRYRRKTRKER